MNARRHIPLRIKLMAALLTAGVEPEIAAYAVKGTPTSKRGEALKRVLRDMLGLNPDDIQIDHQPPLALRDYDETTGLYDPDELDPAHLVPMSTADHRRKTSGHAEGEGFATVAGSDIHAIAKAKRVLRSQIQHRQRLDYETVAEREYRARWPAGRKIRSRGFQKRGSHD
jgi:hypothetical protein